MKLYEVEDLCNRSSLKMNANISLLQDEIMKSSELKDDDTTLLALAGLKQVFFLLISKRIKKVLIF